LFVKKDTRQVQSENAIIEASIRTLLVNPSAGMSEIATAAGVGRATLYRHVESRQALIEKLVLVCMEEMDAATAPLAHLTGGAALEARIDATMPLADRFHFLAELWTIAADSEAITQIDNKLDDELAVLVEQAKRAGQINTDLPTPWVVSFYASTLMAAWWLIASGDVEIDEALIYTKQSFFSGCAKNPGKNRP
jgi:AcrR family transcriptional regulator